MTDRAPNGYAICSLQRSGSTLLGQWLASTGTLGNPQEWFNTAAIRRLIDPAYPADPARQAAAPPAAGATPNGVYGMKLFPNHVDAMRGVAWSAMLPRLKFVHLRRDDRLGAAISQVRAAQTQQYRSGQPAAREPAFDAKAILAALHARAIDEARWQVYFARNAIEPLSLGYEDMLADPQAAVDAVARLVGQPPSAVDRGRITLDVQRDALSDEWRARFLADCGDRDRIDRLVPAWWARARRWLG